MELSDEERKNICEKYDESTIDLLEEWEEKWEDNEQNLENVEVDGMLSALRNMVNKILVRLGRKNVSDNE